MAVLVIVSLRFSALARFDADVPDAAADDLMEYQALRRRIAERSERETVGSHPSG
jgi:hypothetical protein